MDWDGYNVATKSVVNVIEALYTNQLGSVLHKWEKSPLQCEPLRMAIPMALLWLHILIPTNYGRHIDPNELLAADYLDRHQWAIDTEEAMESGGKALQWHKSGTFVGDRGSQLTEVFDLAGAPIGVQGKRANGLNLRERRWRNRFREHSNQDWVLLPVVHILAEKWCVCFLRAVLPPVCCGWVFL